MLSRVTGQHGNRALVPYTPGDGTNCHCKESLRLAQRLDGVPDPRLPYFLTQPYISHYFLWSNNGKLFLYNLQPMHGLCHETWRIALRRLDDALDIRETRYIIDL